MAAAPAGELTWRNDIYCYSADLERTVRSGRLEAEAEMNFLASFTSLFYRPGLEVFGAQYVLGAFVPVMGIEWKSSIGDGVIALGSDEDVSGLGDIAWIPVALFWNRGKLHCAFSQTIVSPTGDYDVDKPLNVGLNYWSFDSNLAMTYLDLESGRDVSVSLGYMYNTENDDTDYKSGASLHVDLAVNQFLSETLAVGVQGFYLDQVSPDSGTGALLGDFKSKAAGIGPALMWATRLGEQDVTLIAKWLHEFDAENRLEGDHVFASFAMDW